MSRQGVWEDERGLTLVEVIVTITVMGIVFAIASSTWFGVVESRRVDSATNQLAADLRLAHTRATNRLEEWQVVLVADSSTYTIGPVGTPSTRDLDEDAGDEVIVDTGATITFEPEGSAVLGDPPPPPTLTVIVRPADAVEPAHEIEINAAISRIQIDPPTP
jgi:prepilin-type N-terminal cleavage/methylation domain-containing protein